MEIPANDVYVLGDWYAGLRSSKPIWATLGQKPRFAAFGLSKQIDIGFVPHHSGEEPAPVPRSTPTSPT
jgi:hypothetical protein